jgi:phosphonate transport system substrate-binding protein
VGSIGERRVEPVTAYLWALPILCWIGCTEPAARGPDGSERPQVVANPPAAPRGDELRLAVGSMLSAVATFEAYDSLFADMSRALGRSYTFLQRRSYDEINDLLQRREVDLAIICSGPYVALPKDAPVELGVIPVVEGETSYRALVIVRADSGAKSFADLEGQRFAYTDPLSHTGYVYPVTRVMALGKDPKTFFGATLFSGAHDRSLMAVDQNLADAASVSSLGFVATVVPGSPYWGRLRVLERSPAYAIPPVVFSTGTPEAVRRQMRDYLLGLSSSEAGRAHLKRLGLDRFILPPADLDYEPVRRMMEAVNATER